MDKAKTATNTTGLGQVRIWKFSKMQNQCYGELRHHSHQSHSELKKRARSDAIVPANEALHVGAIHSELTIAKLLSCKDGVFPRRILLQWSMIMTRDRVYTDHQKKVSYFQVQPHQGIG